MAECANFQADLYRGFLSWRWEATITIESYRATTTHRTKGRTLTRARAQQDCTEWLAQWSEDVQLGWLAAPTREGTP